MQTARTAGFLFDTAEDRFGAIRFFTNSIGNSFLRGLRNLHSDGTGELAAEWLKTVFLRQPLFSQPHRHFATIAIAVFPAKAVYANGLLSVLYLHVL